MKYKQLLICTAILLFLCSNRSGKENTDKLVATGINAQSRGGPADEQVEILKQQVWENLKKIPGTENDYESNIKLRISNGNILDADCRLEFPASSWMIASILVDDYK